jgi:hypothetical protein
MKNVENSAKSNLCPYILFSSHTQPYSTNFLLLQRDISINKYPLKVFKNRPDDGLYQAKTNARKELVL